MDQTDWLLTSSKRSFTTEQILEKIFCWLGALHQIPKQCEHPHEVVFPRYFARDRDIHIFERLAIKNARVSCVRFVAGLFYTFAHIRNCVCECEVLIFIFVRFAG